MLRGCVLFAIVQIIFAQGPPFPPNAPKKCLGPPPSVQKPQECCQIPPFFSDEDFAECGFQKLDDEALKKNPGPPDCSKQICMLKKYNLLTDEETIDEDGIRKFLDDWAAANDAFMPAVEVAKERCVGKALFGPPLVCEANKIVFCISMTIFDICPTWQPTEDCTVLRAHLDECSAFFPK